MHSRWCYIVSALRRKAPLAILALAAVQLAFAAPKVVAVNVDGMIHPITVEIISRALDQARQEGAEIVLVRLNTPGGLLDATQDIIEKVVASPVPVVMFVVPSGGRAASAGFFLLEAGDVAAMAPGTHTGAATPVSLFGGQVDQVMMRKALNDVAALIRGVSAKRGRNSELAEKAVVEAKSFTDKEALDGNLVELVAPDQWELFRKLNGREITRFDGRKQTLHLAAPQVVEYQKTTRERIISAIADPNLALILLVIGALGIYIEFHSPGLVAPGVIGAIMVLMGLSALSVLPINWVGAALLLLAAALFILEAKFATHGVLAVGGAVSMILGALLLIESPLPELRIHLSTAIGITLPFAIITTFLVTLVVRARANKVITGSAGMVDEIGIAHTPLAPAGKVFIHGEFWSAVSSTPVEAGARVRVTEVRGLTLNVEPAPGSTEN
jgi:membrane-bound serine protease (ClpP class)